MHLLILGGTQFLGRAIAAHALAQGHQVTCAARGTSGQVPPGARLVPLDRDTPNCFADLATEAFDAIVDVTRHPGQVRSAIAALRHRTRHWTFISTLSVYADNATQGQTEAAPLLPPTPPEVDFGTPETYGPAKVACEHAVGPDALIVRAGLIVGPEDPTGRFTYWPTRLARCSEAGGGEVLVGGSPEDSVQQVDVRDLAQWIVAAAQSGLTGAFNATGPAIPWAQFLADCAGTAQCRFSWVDRAFLEAQGVKRWSGPRALPMWLPMPDFAGFNTRSIAPARAAGLTFRPLSQTAQDTLHWARTADAPATGLTPAEEAAVLAAWHVAATTRLP
jgi:2'-hydroxyisoflavone reductase